MEYDILCGSFVVVMETFVGWCCINPGMSLTDRILCATDALSSHREGWSHVCTLYPPWDLPCRVQWHAFGKAKRVLIIRSLWVGG